MKVPLEDPFQLRQHDIVQDPPVWSGEELPAWCYQSSGVRFVNDCSWAIPSDPLDKASERAWVYLVRVNILVWSFWALCPFAGLFLSRCREHGEEGLATSPQVLMAAYVPVLMLAIYWEVLAHGYIMPTQLKFLGPWRFMGMQNWRVFYAVGLSTSLLGHLDLASNGIFMARVVKTAQCQNNLEQIWSEVVGHSAVRALPSITTLTLAGYLLMLPQLVFALLGGIPKWRQIQAKGFFQTEPQEEWFDVCDQHKASKWAPVHTVLCECRGYALITALASSARAGLVMMRSSAFLLGETTGFGFQAYPKVRRNFVVNMRNLAVRGFLNFLLEGAVQANLQVSVLALSRALSQGAPADLLTALSAALSIAMLLYNVTMTGSTLMKMTQRAWNRVECKKVPTKGQEKVWGAAVDTEEEVESRRRNIIYMWTFFGLSAGLSLCLSLYAGMKLVAAVFVCPMGVWNLSGCVQV